MGFNFSGRAAQGSHDNLQELLAAQLQEEMLRANQAQQDRQLGQSDQRIALDREQLTQAAQQHRDRMGLDTRQLDEQATGRREQANQRGVIEMEKIGQIQDARDKTTRDQQLFDEAMNNPEYSPEVKQALKLSRITNKEYSPSELENPDKASERRIKEQAAAAYATAAAQAKYPKDGGAGGGKLSATSVDKLAGLASASEALDSVEGLFPKMNSYVGPIAGRAGAAQQYTPLASKDLATFHAELATLRNSVIKAITGAQMSEPEAARIMSQLPDENTQPEVFAARMATTRRNLDTIKRATMELSGMAPKMERTGKGDTTPATSGGDAYAAYLASRQRK